MVERATLGNDPEPTVEELHQVDPDCIAVPVRHEGPMTTHELPSRSGVVTDFGLTTVWQMVLGDDLKRKRVTLIAAAAWMISHAPHGGATWPANVPLVINHAGKVYARVAAVGTDLTVIPEEWAD